MIDLEKVIKGMELCRYDPDPGMPLKSEVSCDICPYWDDTYGCRMNDMFDDALSKLGITAKTTICSMTLNEEDAKAINDWLDSVSHPGRSTGCPPVDLSEKALKEWINKGMHRNN